jgi:hypothetical protein
MLGLQYPTSDLYICSLFLTIVWKGFSIYTPLPPMSKINVISHSNICHTSIDSSDNMVSRISNIKTWYDDIFYVYITWDKLQSKYPVYAYTT